ncbi:uncharacterized protein [Nicotiana sylvestris]|uniref:uncharacterized protein n=1 Tax=Nicotiana sylvestris TaxID=4096 RepID=UPI00388C3501
MEEDNKKKWANDPTKVMGETHYSRYSIHPRETKLYYNIREVYWWDRMKKDIAEFVAQCPNCQQVKIEHQKPGGLLLAMEILTWKWEYRGAQFTANFWRSFQKGLGLSYHSSIQLALYEALYGRKCRPPIGWFDVGKTMLVEPELIQWAIKKIKLIQDRLLATQSRQKSYADNQRRNLEFQVDDWVFLKVSPMKGVIRFGKKGILSPRYIGPYRVIRKVGQVAYELDLPSDLESVHPVFHVSMLRKCIGDPSKIMSVDDVQVTELLSYEETLIIILDRQFRILRTKGVASVKVFWRNNNVEEMTWEAEEDMKSRYPNLFPPPEKDLTETSQP